MIRQLLLIASGSIALGAASVAGAAPAAFTAGPVFTEYGKVASVDNDLPVSASTRLKVIFNVSDDALAGTALRGFDSVARFINMNAAAGVLPANIEAVIVVHGKASWYLTNAEAFARHDADHANASADLVTQLLAHNVTIYLCGQSAAANGIAKSDLIPGVKMSLSAMNAFAQLQPQGYVLIP